MRATTTIYVRFGFVACFLFLHGCTLIAPAQPPIVAPTGVNLPAPYYDNNVRIVVEGVLKDGNGTVIGVTGTATNTGAANLRFCAVQFDVIDSAGHKVAEAYADTSGLKSRQTWRYQAMFRFPYPETFQSIVGGGVALCQQ
jgi:hypothetical protein